MMRNRGQKKRIKDCLSQLKHLDSVYAAEIKKPEAEQDADLLEECLETMSYLHDIVESLSRQTGVQRSGAGNRIVLRRVAIVAIALAVLLIGMSVAEAAGFRVWSALIHWDSRYLHVTFAPEDQEGKLQSSPESVNCDEEVTSQLSDAIEYNYTSIDEALTKLDSTILLPEYLPEGMIVSDITYYEFENDQTQVYLVIQWANETDYILYSVMLFDDDEWSTSNAFPQTQNDAKYEVIGGIEYITLDNQVIWTAGNALYTIETNINTQNLQSILSSMSYR